MTKSEIVSEIAREQGIKRDVVLRVVNSLVDHIMMSMRMRDEVRFTGFGKFYVKHFKPHRLMSIRTGEQMVMPESDRIVFKQSNYIKI